MSAQVFDPLIVSQQANASTGANPQSAVASQLDKAHVSCLEITGERRPNIITHQPQCSIHSDPCAKLSVRCDRHWHDGILAGIGKQHREASFPKLKNLARRGGKNGAVLAFRERMGAL